MPKGKIAVIETCSKCPYKAFDNTLGVVINHKEKTKTENDTEVAYCGYFKPLDPTKLRIEEYLDLENDDNHGQPDECPLPDGNDNSKWRNVVGEDSGKYPNSTE